MLSLLLIMLSIVIVVEGIWFFHTKVVCLVGWLGYMLFNCFSCQNFPMDMDLLNRFHKQKYVYYAEFIELLVHKSCSLLYFVPQIY
jgi:hypothetical protein